MGWRFGDVFYGGDGPRPFLVMGLVMGARHFFGRSSTRLWICHASYTYNWKVSTIQSVILTAEVFQSFIENEKKRARSVRIRSYSRVGLILYTAVYHIILLCTTSYCCVPYHTVSYCTPCHTVQVYHVIRYTTILYCIPHHTVCIIILYTISYSVPGTPYKVARRAVWSLRLSNTAITAHGERENAG